MSLFVTMLPITPGKHRIFMSLLTPIATDLIVKYTGARCHLLLNTHSCIRQTTDHVELDRYCKTLEWLGISYPIEDDNNEAYRNFVEKQVHFLFDRGFLSVEKEVMSWCPCGRVEVLRNVIPQLTQLGLTKLIKTRGKNRWFCNICNNELQESSEKFLLLKTRETCANITPLFWQQEFLSIQKRIAKQGVIISRRHRHNGQLIKVKGEYFYLDPDFRWMCLINFLAYNKEEVVLVAGADSVNHAANVVMLSAVFYPKRKYTVFVHPLIRIKKDDPLEKRLNIEEFIRQTKHPVVVRAFLALGLQKTRITSELSISDLYWLEKSVFPRDLKVPMLQGEHEHLHNFLKNFSRQSLLRLFKVLRMPKAKLTKKEAFLWQLLCH